MKKSFKAHLVPVVNKVGVTGKYVRFALEIDDDDKWHRLVADVMDDWKRNHYATASDFIIRYKSDERGDRITEIQDYLLSLRACQAIVNAADSSKKSVRAAQYIFTNMIDWSKGTFVDEIEFEVALMNGTLTKLPFSSEFDQNVIDRFNKEWWLGQHMWKATTYSYWKNFNELIEITEKKYGDMVVSLTDINNHACPQGLPHQVTLKNNAASSGLRGRATHKYDPSIAEDYFSMEGRLRMSRDKAHLIRTMVPYVSGRHKFIQYKPEYLMDEQFMHLLMMEADAKIPAVKRAKMHFAAKLRKIRKEEQIEFVIDNLRYTEAAAAIQTRYDVWEELTETSAALYNLLNEKVYISEESVYLSKPALDKALYLMPTDEIIKALYLRPTAEVEDHENTAVLNVRLTILVKLYRALKTESITADKDILIFIQHEGELGRQLVKRVTGKYPENLTAEYDIEEAKKVLRARKQ